MKRGAQIFGHLLAVAITVVIAFYVNKYWSRLPWVTESFVSVLWVYNLSVLVTVISHLIQAVIGISLVKILGQIAENILSVALFVTAYYVFPFNINDGTESAVKIILLIITVIVAIGTIAEFAKLFSISGRNEN